MRRGLIVFLITALLLFSSTAFAERGRGNSNNIKNGNSEAAQCVRTAAKTFQSCNRTCKAAFDTTKSECGLNKTCRNACREAFETCTLPYETALDACKDSCEAPIEAAKEACKIQAGCTSGCYKNVAFLTCLRPALTTKFNCKKDCVDAQRTDSVTQTALSQCKATFKSCKRDCKNIVTPTPTVPAQ